MIRDVSNVLIYFHKCKYFYKLLGVLRARIPSKALL